MTLNAFIRIVKCMSVETMTREARDGTPHVTDHCYRSDCAHVLMRPSNLKLWDRGQMTAIRCLTTLMVHAVMKVKDVARIQVHVRS